MKNVIIFASGNGSNAEKIMQYFLNSKAIQISYLFTNKAEAKVVAIAKKYTIPTGVIDKAYLNSLEMVTDIEQLQPDLIVLAGFLLQFPAAIIAKFHNRIINLHPALLPKYGGKGMFGLHVHQSVFENNERETGITIHYVNENYDEGEFVFQKAVAISDCKSPQEIANKIHALEHQYLPLVIETLLTT